MKLWGLIRWQDKREVFLIGALLTFVGSILFVTTDASSVIAPSIGQNFYTVKITNGSSYLTQPSSPWPALFSSDTSAVQVQIPYDSKTKYDSVPLAAINLMPPNQPQTRNFVSGIYCHDWSKTPDKGRCILIDNNNSVSDGMYINNLGGGDGIAIDTGDRSRPANYTGPENSNSIVTLLKSKNSIGFRAIGASDSGGPTLLQLEQQATTPSEMARYSVFGNAAHTVIIVRNYADNPQVKAFVVQRDGIDQFVLSGYDGSITTNGNENIKGTLTVSKILMTSPNGTIWALSISNNGTLVIGRP